MSHKLTFSDFLSMFSFYVKLFRDRNVQCVRIKMRAWPNRPLLYVCGRRLSPITAASATVPAPPVILQGLDSPVSHCEGLEAWLGNAQEGSVLYQWTSPRAQSAHCIAGLQLEARRHWSQTSDLPLMGPRPLPSSSASESLGLDHLEWP